jgi:hypothetical protein
MVGTPDKSSCRVSHAYSILNLTRHILLSSNSILFQLEVITYLSDMKSILHSFIISPDVAVQIVVVLKNHCKL